jgi:protein-L-isoaspartate(D-aspartate) O-methyltransferase
MDFAAARKAMVDTQVRTNDVTDLRIQFAIESIPRELFLPKDLRPQAYVERELAYAPGRRMLTIRDLAKLLAAADVRPRDLVLDVACGLGYSTAILASLAETVVGIESDQQLAQAAQENLNAVGAANAAIIAGDPAAGAGRQGPFDLIFIGGAIAAEPDRLLAQLKDGGRLAAIRRENGVSRGVLYRRAGTACAPRILFDAASTAIIPGFDAPKRFVF